MWRLTVILLVCILENDNFGYAKHLGSAEDLEDERIYQKYVEMDKNVKNLVNRGVKLLLPYVMEANEYLNLSSSCKKDAFQLLTGIRNLEMPAIKIVDATGKFSSGLLSGSIRALGDYDECMSTSVFSGTGKLAFKGQYCMVQVRPLLPKKKGRITLDSRLEILEKATKNSSEIIQYLASLAPISYDYPTVFGFCTPSGCSSSDVNLLLNYFGDKVYLNASVMYCDQEDNVNITGAMKIAIIAFSILGFLALIGSLLDYYSKEKGVTFENANARFLLCFSVQSNFPKVISAKSQTKSLGSLCGVRSLSLFYVILTHECLAEGIFNSPSLGYIEYFPQFFFQIIANGILTTEVFFFLGGFFNTYYRMKLYESTGKKLNFLQIIIHRLWRLYPAYLFSILATFLLSNSHGPATTFAKKDWWNNCQWSWWKNVLFINNFVHNFDQCMSHTWYIAADMQLFVISLLTVPVLLRCAKRGIILHTVILFAGIAVTVSFAWYARILPSTILYELDVLEKFKMTNFYMTTFPHIAPYFTGLITGYIISAWKDLKINLVYQIIGWCLAVTCFMSVLFITRIWNAGVEYTVVESALYFGFSKFLYVLAIAWMVVCCVKGYGGVLNYILSLKIWIPISRLSYMMYLLSVPIQLFYYGNLRMTTENSRMVFIWRYLGTLVVTASMSLVMVLMVESPFVALEKLLFKRKTTEENKNVAIAFVDQDNKITNRDAKTHL